MLTYTATTHDIAITVRPLYLDEPSDLLRREFSFAYAVSIENRGTEDVTLLRRRWIIEESNGSRHDLEGDTELRAQRTLAPGDVHHFDRSCTLASFAATVNGNYLVQRPNGEQFQAAAPTVPLYAAAN